MNSRRRISKKIELKPLDLTSSDPLKKEINEATRRVARAVGASKEEELKKIRDVFRTKFYKYGSFSIGELTNAFVEELGIRDAREKDRLNHILKNMLQTKKNGEIKKRFFSEKEVPSYTGKASKVERFSIWPDVLREQKELLKPKEEQVLVYRQFKRHGIRLRNEKTAERILSKLKNGATRADIDLIVAETARKEGLDEKELRLAVSRALTGLEKRGVIKREKFVLPSSGNANTSHGYVYGADEEVIERTARKVGAVSASEFKHAGIKPRQRNGSRRIVKKETSKSAKVIERRRGELSFDAEKTAGDFMRNFAMGKVKSVEDLKEEMMKEPLFKRNPSLINEKLKEVEDYIRKYIKDEKLLKKMGFK